MSFIVSANAPEFALHHCFVDKIWHDWQAKTVKFVEQAPNSVIDEVTAKLKPLIVP